MEDQKEFSVFRRNKNVEQECDILLLAERWEELAVTRFHNQSLGTGDVLNQVQNVYNDFAQLTQSYQAHGGIKGVSPL